MLFQCRKLAKGCGNPNPACTIEFTVRRITDQETLQCLRGGIKTRQFHNLLLHPLPLILWVKPETALSSIVDGENESSLTPLGKRLTMYRRHSKTPFAVEIQGAGTSKHR